MRNRDNQIKATIEDTGDAISDPSKLTLLQQLVAHFLNLRLTDEEVCARAGVDQVTIDSLRANPFFKLYLGDLFLLWKKTISADAFSTTEGVTKEFDSIVRDAFEAYATIVKSADKDMARLAAAKEILDRSSVAPKVVKKEEQDRSIHIIIEGAVRERIERGLRQIGNDTLADEFSIDAEYEEQKD